MNEYLQERNYLRAEEQELINTLRNDPDSRTDLLTVCILPTSYHRYFYDYGRCLLCKQTLRQEMHAYHHYRKFHWRAFPRYFVYHQCQWRETPMHLYLKAKTLGLPTAITKKMKKPKKPKTMTAIASG